MNQQRITVIGSGYVGTVVAGCLAHIGHQVVGVEVEPAKLAVLRSGRAPFHEPGLDDLLADGTANGTLRFTDDLVEAMSCTDIVFICVGTPSGPDGLPDMTAMRSVVRVIAANLDSHHILVNKSTVPVGSGRWLSSMIDDMADEPAEIRSRYSVVSNPEFLREGNAVQDFLYPDRVVLGCDDPAALDVMVDVYGPILRAEVQPDRGRGPVPLVRTGLVTAEMTKYASNAFLATKISFANEMARLCDLVGADVAQVTAGMGLDNRIGGQFLAAGLGWGGSCFGKDTAALISTAKEYGYTTRILAAAVDVNADQRQLVVDALLGDLKTLRGARIALLGLAFKPGTDDVRDSPAVDVARRLMARGCFVTASDPLVSSVPGLEEMRVAADPYEAARGADAVVLATDWREYLALDLVRLRSLARGDLFFDGRNGLDPAAVEEAGWRYRGIGRARRRVPSVAPVERLVSAD
jgi:nucleotide sugar dehydrogenase